MSRLGPRDLKALLDYLGDLYAAANLEDCRRRALRGLNRIVPSDSSFWTELNVQTRQAVRLVHPVDAGLPDEARMVAQFAHEHPVYMHDRQTGDVSAHTITDFATPQQWRRTALYNEMYRPRRIEEQITFMVRTRPPSPSGVQLNRQRRSFAEHERVTLNLLRPHLVEIYQNLETAARARRALSQARSVIDHLDCGVVVIDGNGRIGLANRRAWHALAVYFSDRARRADALPDTLERWLSGQHRAPRDVMHPQLPLIIDRGSRRLVIRLIKDDSQSLLLLEEKPQSIDSALLACLDLTPRETEVLTWVAQGKTDAEIATILDRRPKTVGKHLERIYQKLGVETRTAAAARAFETALLVG